MALAPDQTQCDNLNTGVGRPTATTAINCAYAKLTAFYGTH